MGWRKVPVYGQGTFESLDVRGQINGLDHEEVGGVFEHYRSRVRCAFGGARQ